MKMQIIFERAIIALLIIALSPIAALLILNSTLGIKVFVGLFGIPVASLHDPSETLLNIIQTMAIIMAGIWTYYHFIKGRTFHSRLNLELQIEPLLDGNRKYIKASVKATNVGSAKIAISSDFSVFYIIPGKTLSNGSAEIRWDDAAKIALPLFTDHTWVEAGETIYEERMVCMRGPEKSFKAEARFRSSDQKRVVTAVTRFQP